MRYPSSWPKRRRDLEGRRVRALRTIANRSETYVEAGAVGTITRAFGGLSIRFDTCGKCRVGFYVTKADPFSVELLPPEAKP